MFGYIKPYVPELRVREHELYRGIYCGLCRSMGRVTGQLSRFTLSYDFVFLAAVRLLLTEGSDVPLTFRRVRCPTHPLTVRETAEDCGTFRYAASVSAALLSAKLEDDIADERGAARLLSRMIRPEARHMTKKSGKFYSSTALDTPEATSFRPHEACSRIPTLLRELDILETERCSSIDRCASAFGEVTALVFESGLDGAARRIAREIGAGAGRFIYIADACDDAADDMRLGRYNPIIEAYGSKAVEGERLSDTVGGEIFTAAMLDLERASGAAELAIDYFASEGDAREQRTAVGAIVRNIIYLGMPHILGSIIKSEKTERKKGRCNG